MKLQLICKVNNSRISSSSSDEIRKFISSMEGKDIEITLQKRRSKRSNQQNRYYFGAVLPIICNALKELGHRLTIEECHEFLKVNFNATDIVNTSTGEIISGLPKSTTTMTKTEFAEYIDKIAEWSAEKLNIVIPEPESQVQINYN